MDLQVFKAKQHADLLQSLRIGINDDLRRKLANGDLAAPIDAKALSKEIFDTMEAQPTYSVALRFLEITVTDVKVALIEVCTSNHIAIRRSDG